MRADPGMIGSALDGEIEGQLEPQARRPMAEPGEVGVVSQRRMDRRVPPLGGPDRPWAADVVRGCGDGVVGPLAMGAADGVDRCQVEDVKPHLLHIVEPLGEVGQRAMPPRLPRP